MLGFDAAAAVDAYQPFDARDCDKSQFAERLLACLGCVHRRDNLCAFDGELLAVRARRKSNGCLAGAYPALLPPDRVASIPAARPRAQAVRPQRQPGKALQALLLAPALHNPGGIERWLVAMTRYIPEVSAGSVQVPAVIVRHPANADRQLIDEISRYTRVVLCDDTPQVNSQIRQLIVEADVIVASGVNVNLPAGVGNVERLIDGARCPVVFCSHSCCPYSEVLSRAAMDSGLVRHWTSVGHTAKGIFPDDIADQVVAIENGAEIERCTPIRGRAWQRQQWGLRDDHVAIGFIGRLHEEKRPQAVAEALQHLPNNYVGLVYGTGIHSERIIAESQARVGDRVRFMGCTSYLGDVLAGLDLWLLASPAEGFCLARVEAQLAGVPVVSTPTGEIPRLEQEHGQLTWRVPIGASGEQIATVVHQAAVQRFQTRQLVERARLLAWQRYTAPAMAGRWVDYFRSITGEK